MCEPYEMKRLPFLGIGAKFGCNFLQPASQTADRRFEAEVVADFSSRPLLTSQIITSYRPYTHLCESVYT